jgi:hypothetical protein
LNGFRTNHVEYKVGVNDADTITRILKFIIPWYAAKEWVSFEIPDTLIYSFNKRCGIGWTVICDPVEY